MKIGQVIFAIKICWWLPSVMAHILLWPTITHRVTSLLFLEVPEEIPSLTRKLGKALARTKGQKVPKEYVDTATNRVRTKLVLQLERNRLQSFWTWKSCVWRTDIDLWMKWIVTPVMQLTNYWGFHPSGWLWRFFPINLLIHHLHFGSCWKGNDKSKGIPH